MLHARGELVAVDARLEIAVAGVLGEVLFVEVFEQFELPLLAGPARCGGGIEIENVRLARPDHGALVNRRAASRWSSFRCSSAAGRCGLVERQIGGQFLGLAAEAIAEPGAERRPARVDAAGVERDTRTARDCSRRSASSG